MVSGAVTCEDKRASEIGTAMLAAGGNAADAIIACILAVGTLCMYHSDLGGGGFAIIRTPEGKYEGLDFRQCAPKAAHEDIVMDQSSPKGLTVAVPGELRGLEALHKKYGRLPWKRLFEDCIEMAEKGYELKADLHKYTSKVCSSTKLPPFKTNRKGSVIDSDKEFDFLFDTNGEILPQGSTIKRPEYAAVLKAVADNGANAFYGGPVAEGVIRAIQGEGGIMTLEDLAGYKTKWMKPIKGQYKDKSLWSVPSPASGAIWAHALGILSNLETEGPGSLTDLHRMIEVQRLAYPQRTQLGDPPYVPSVEDIERNLVDPAVCKERARMVDDTSSHPPEYYKKPFAESKFDTGTSNMTAADSDGLIISITTTVGANFGSRIIVPGFGMVLNDSMQDFSSKGVANWTGYESSPANYIAPGKRPLSSSCPYIIEDAQDRPYLAGGAAGGSTIISGNVQVARNVLDYDMSAGEALRASRVHNQVSPNVTQVESPSTHQGITVDGLSADQAKALEAKGHVLDWWPESRTVPCAIKFHHTEPGVKWDAAADPRREEAAASVYTSS